MANRCLLMAVLFTTVAVVAKARADDSREGDDDLPQLVLYGPNSDDLYQDTSTIAITGRIDPPLDIDVKIALYSIVDDERVLMEGGVGARVDREGRFSVNLTPRSGGWTAGTLRCVVSGGMRTLQESVEFGVVDHSDPTPIVLPKDSGITIDVGDPSTLDDPDEVIATQTFYLTGTFSWDGSAERGPSVPVQIIHVDPVRMQDVTAQSHSALTYVNKDGVAVFDAPIVAPSLPGLYLLQIRCPVAGENGRVECEIIERPLSILPGGG